MQLLESIILGIIQGLTEFIPVSSSGHLVIAQVFLSGASNHLFLEYISIGTTLSLIIYFRKRIISLVRDVFRMRRYRFALNLLITAIPAGAVGFTLAGFIESNPFFGSLTTVAVTLMVVGILMVVLEKLPKASSLDTIEALTPKRALVIGLAQVFALIPGVSRSGSTIIAGRFAGLKSADAAEYSFLASLPIMLGVILKIFVSNGDYVVANLDIVIVSNIAAFIAGIAAIGFLMRFLSRHGLALFGWYRIGLSLVLISVILLQ